jgi:predicted transcriptional regulator
MKLRELGFTFQHIADLLGLSREKVRQIFNREKHARKMATNTKS